MKTQSPDTSPDAERVQIELLRQATIAQRFHLVRSLTATTRRLAWRAIREANPGASDEEVDLLFVRVHYGPELAESAARVPRPAAAMIAEDILAAITPVVDAFEQLGIRYHIGGSVASSVYGVARSTLDADLVADLHYAQIAAFVARLGTAYYLDQDAIQDAVQRRASFNLIHLDTMIKVDVFVLKAHAFDQAAFQRTRQAALDKTDPRVFPLASPEDVVLHKLGWYRAAGGVSDRQWNDILGVLKVQAIRLDRAYLQQWAARLDLTDLLDRAWQEAGVPES